MSKIQQMLSTYPADTGMAPQKLAKAVDKLYEAAGVCTSCADACSAEQDPAMLAMSTKCMRMDQDCADICTTTARVLARQTGYDAPTTMALLEACMAALRACGDACGEMTEHEHCTVCASVCRDTEKMLAKMAKEMQSSAAEAGSADGYSTEKPSMTTPAGKELAGAKG